MIHQWQNFRHMWKKLQSVGGCIILLSGGFPTALPDYNPRTFPGILTSWMRMSCQFQAFQRVQFLTPSTDLYWSKTQGCSIPLFIDISHICGLLTWHILCDKKVIIIQAQVDQVKTWYQDYFKANVLFLNVLNSTVWTPKYTLPYHTVQLFKELGHGLRLYSMQGREAKHVKLAM